MKNLMLFTVLIGLGFTGGSLFPNIMADAENTKAEENCNCGCGPTEVKLMMVPTGSDMLLTTNLIEAISNDADNSLTSEELVAIISEVQKESTELSNQTAVLGTSIGFPESEMKTTINSYEEIINRFLSSSISTTQETTQDESEPMAEQSSLQSSVLIKENEITTESAQTKKTKNNNGLGNGSEPADGTSTDVKGIDPSNPGNGQKNSQKSVTGTSSKMNVNTSTKAREKTDKTKASSKASTKSQESKDKEKNNNGLGNGSEPADGTTSDIKGVDPSNPGNGGSKNNAGN